MSSTSELEIECAINYNAIAGGESFTGGSIIDRHRFCRRHQSLWLDLYARRSELPNLRLGRFPSSEDFADFMFFIFNVKIK